MECITCCASLQWVYLAIVNQIIAIIIIMPNNYMHTTAGRYRPTFRSGGVIGYMVLFNLQALVVQ